MNVILCGYHWTGCEALRQLLMAGHQVFVFTHESPHFVPSLVEYCKARGIPYSTVNVSKAELPFRPDVIASIYYRYIIKQSVIDACQGRVFNLHPSLLPAYRGCSSLTWAMLKGEVNAGYTYHYIDEGCDTGRILLQRNIDIHPFDTQGTLFQRVLFRAMEDFQLAFELVLNGETGREQVGDASHYPRGCPYNGTIDPKWSDDVIELFIRAMVHPPYPPANYQGEPVYTMEDFRRLRMRDRLLEVAGS